MREGGVQGGALGSTSSPHGNRGRINDGGSNLVGSVRSSPRRVAPSEIKKKIIIVKKWQNLPRKDRKKLDLYPLSTKNYCE